MMMVRRHRSIAFVCLFTVLLLARSGGLDGALSHEVAFDPERREVVYAATDRGLFRSLDGGLGIWVASAKSDSTGTIAAVGTPVRRGRPSGPGADSGRSWACVTCWKWLPVT